MANHGTLGERSARLWGELTHWIANNGADIALALAAALTITFVLIGLRALGQRMVRNRTPDVHWRTIFARVLARTSLFFIVTCALELVVGQTDAPYAIRRTAEILFIVGAALQAAVWTRELILGIGGIAIGLAAQGIFSDLFAALSIIFDRPFRVGHAIRVGQIVGIVEYIGLKTTRIRSLEGEQIVISNAKLLDQQLHNFARLDRRRFTLRFGLVYRTPPETLRRVPELARGIVEAHAGTTFIRCGLAAYGASSLDYELVFEVEGRDFEPAFATRHAIAIEILEAFAAEGIEFAYPTQTTYTAAPDGTLVMPYAVPASADERSR